jgi:predicted dienelactone hydrolase
MRAGSPRILILALLLALLGGAGRAQGADYDPLAVAPGFQPESLALVVVDPARSREIPLRVYLPRGTGPSPVVLFSHGLGGSRDGNAYLGRHWSGRGFVAVFLQHPGSDASMWQPLPPARRLAALKGAANLRNTLLRLGDVPAVIDQLERWNRAADSPLEGRLDLDRIGMSGHSFGALTTQWASGQRTAGGRAPATDPRIKAAVILSPSLPSTGGDPKAAFAGVRIPWLLMTGTHDVAFIGAADLASRLGVFPALPPGGKYELVLDGAEHSAFGDGPLPGDRLPRNPGHHRSILALSTAFWEAWLRQEAPARAWLEGPGPRQVLDPKDRWQRK